MKQQTVWTRRAALPGTRWAERSLVFVLALFAGVVPPLLAQSPVPFGDAWDWPLQPRWFGELSQSERDKYQRAEDMVRRKNYEAAAIEFQKFIAQSPRSPVRPHALLLQGYAMHLAKKRGRAIEIYTEVMDFYSEKVDQAVPAAYLKAHAQFQNGNTAQGMQILEDLVANETFRAHAVCDLAFNELARRYVAEDKVRKAEGCWRAVLEAFTEAFLRPPSAAREAHRELTELYIRQGRLDVLDDILELDVPYSENKGEVAAAMYAYGRAVGKVERKERREFLSWFRGHEDAFDRAGMTADFLGQAMTLAGRIDEREQWSELLAEYLLFCREARGKRIAAPAANICTRLSEATRAGWDVADGWKSFSELVKEKGDALRTSSRVELYAAVMDRFDADLSDGTPAGELWNTLVSRLEEIYEGLLNPARDEGLASLVDRVTRKRQFARALGLCRRIETPALSAWKEAGVYAAQKQYEKAAQACEAVEEVDSGTLAAQALQMRALLYKERLSRFDDAITLFQLINNPPATIWQIVDCQEMKGDPQAAVSSCSEIENFFENDAPQAAYRKALIWQAAGQSKQAIAEARRVLKAYPRHQVASQAHQLLERYGIATGGGVMDEE